MATKNSLLVRDGVTCDVIGGTHKGKSGTVRDIHTSKTSQVTITVVQSDGARFDSARIVSGSGTEHVNSIRRGYAFSHRVAGGRDSARNDNDRI